jgi:LmbE family N-acetylglucosaminyl deacetylase
VSDARAPLPEALSAPEHGRVLLLAPHADDDVIGAGGTAALHAAQGDAVRVLVVFDGVAGDPERRHDPAELRRTRQAEARAGGAHLGLRDYDFWGYPEGHQPGCEELRAGARRMADYVRGWAPEIVYAPWIGEYHLDHHVLARVARLALALARFSGRAWGYEVWTPLVPTRIVDVSAYYERKVAAIREHRSQLEYTDHVHRALGMQAQRSLYLSAAARWGEAFAPLGPPSAADRAALGLA